jgi:hypothetical protein
MMQFFRKQQEKIALRLLAWQYHKAGIPLPPISQLTDQAAQVVQEAHRIAAARGHNVVSIFKEVAMRIVRGKIS